LEKSAQTHGKELVIARVSNTQELISGIDDARARGATALNVLASPMLFQSAFTGLYKWTFILGPTGGNLLR
jgi:hypothetical protein